MDAIQQLMQEIDDSELWSKKLELKRNEFLIKTGQVEKYLYFIQEGSIRYLLLTVTKK